MRVFLCALLLSACGQEAVPTAPLVHFDVRRDVAHGAIRPACAPHNRMVRAYFAGSGDVIPLEPLAGWCDYEAARNGDGDLPAVP